MLTSIEQLIYQIHTDRAERAGEGFRKPRSRWSSQEEQLFEHLVASFGSDYALLGSFLPRKTEKQIRKKYRQLLRYRPQRLDKLEKEILVAKRKAYFDQLLEEEEPSSSVGSRSRSPSLDELQQSLQWGWLTALSLYIETMQERGEKMQGRKFVVDEFDEKAIFLCQFCGGQDCDH